MPNESIGGISVSIAVGLQDLQAQLQQAQSMSAQAGQAMAAAFNGASAAATGLSTSLDGVGSSLTPLLGLGLALAPISAGIFEAGKSALEAAGHFEQWQVSFTRLLGSEQAAKDMLEELVNFATKTPFEIPDVVSNAQRLMAFGFAAKDVIPTLTALGDAVSGLGRGAQSLNSLVLAFGEMEAKGVVQLRQLNMLTNQGIPAIELLAKAYNVSVTEMSTAITKKLVPSAEAIPVLLAGITQKFGGMMDSQSRTFLGMLSNLSDAAMKTFAAIGNTMLPVAKDLENAGFAILNSLTNAAKAFETLPAPVQEATIALAAVGAAAAPVALALGAVGLAITSIGAALPVLIPIAGIIAGIAAAVALLHFSDVDSEALHFFQTIHDGWAGLTDLISGVTDAVRSFGSELKLLAALFPGVSYLGEVFGAIASSIHNVRDAIDLLFPGLQATREAFQALATMTEFLSGHYKSMDEAGKKVALSLDAATKASIDAATKNILLTSSVTGVTEHLTLGTVAHQQHAGAVAHTAKVTQTWNDVISASLGLAKGNKEMVTDLGAAFKYLGDQVAAADELWKHYIVDAGQALDIMAKGTGTVGGFTVSMENGVEMIKGSAEALQTTSGKILDFTSAETEAAGAVGGLTSSLDSQASAFDHLGVTAETAGKRTHQALTGLEDGFKATTGQVDALSVGISFLAMQMSGWTALAGSGGLNQGPGGGNPADLEHQLWLARNMTGDPMGQLGSIAIPSKFSGAMKALETAATSVGTAAANTTASLTQYVDGMGNVYDSYQQMVDAIDKNPALGGLFTTVTKSMSDFAGIPIRALSSGVDGLTSSVDNLGTSSTSAASAIQSAADSQQTLADTMVQTSGAFARSSNGWAENVDEVTGRLAADTAMLQKAIATSYNDMAHQSQGTQVQGEEPGTFHASAGAPGSQAAMALVPLTKSQAGAPSSPMSVFGDTAIPQQNTPNVTMTMNYPSFNNQQQAEQIMKQVVTQLRTVVGSKL